MTQITEVTHRLVRFKKFYEIIDFNVDGLEIRDSRTWDTVRVIEVRDLVLHELMLHRQEETELHDIIEIYGLTATCERENHITLSIDGLSAEFEYGGMKPGQDASASLLYALHDLFSDAESHMGYEETIDGFAEWLNDMGYNRADAYEDYEKNSKLSRNTCPPLTNAAKQWVYDKELYAQLKALFRLDYDIFKEATNR